MEEFTKFLNSDIMYLIITFFLVLFLIMVLANLIVALVKARAGGFAFDLLKFFCLIIGGIYTYSNVENTLSNSCPQLDPILKFFTYLGFIITFMKFISAGALQLIVNQDNRYYWPVFKEFLSTIAPWLVGLAIATSVSNLTGGYLSWLCKTI